MAKTALLRLVHLYLWLSVFMFGAYGTVFLVFGQQLSIVRYGGFLADPHFWGVTFLANAVVVYTALQLQQFPYLLRLAFVTLVCTSTAYDLASAAIAVETGRDFTRTIVWTFIVGCHLLMASIVGGVLTNAQIHWPGGIEFRKRIIGWRPSLPNKGRPQGRAS